ATGNIGAAHGKTVDRGIVERRQTDGRHQVVGEDAAQRAVQARGLAAVDRNDPLGNQPLRVGDRQQRAVEGKAIVGELRHQTSLPILSGDKASACRTFAIDSTSSSMSTGSAAPGSGASAAMATMQSSSGCSSGLPTMA